MHRAQGHEITAHLLIARTGRNRQPMAIGLLPKRCLLGRLGVIGFVRFGIAAYRDSFLKAVAIANRLPTAVGEYSWGDNAAYRRWTTAPNSKTPRRSGGLEITNQRMLSRVIGGWAGWEPPEL